MIARQVLGYAVPLVTIHAVHVCARKQYKGLRDLSPEPDLWSGCTESLLWTAVFSTLSESPFCFSPVFLFMPTIYYV